MLLLLILFGVGRLQRLAPVRTLYFFPLLDELTLLPRFLYDIIKLYLFQLHVFLLFDLLEIHLRNELRGVEPCRHKQRLLVVDFRSVQEVCVIDTVEKVVV